MQIFFNRKKIKRKFKNILFKPYESYKTIILNNASDSIRTLFGLSLRYKE